jgi:hypothetical protein
MSTRKTTVQVHLSDNELARLDMFRHHLRSRSGKLPMRSVAMAILVRDLDCNVEKAGLKTFVAIIDAVDNHTERLDTIEQKLKGK